MHNKNNFENVVQCNGNPSIQFKSTISRYLVQLLTSDYFYYAIQNKTPSHNALKI